MNSQASIFIAGADTLIGGAIVRQLRREGFMRVGDVPEPAEAAAADVFLRAQTPFAFLLRPANPTALVPNKPDDAPIKLPDSTAVRQIGWQPRAPVRSALSQTCAGFLRSQRRRARTHAEALPGS